MTVFGGFTPYIMGATAAAFIGLSSWAWVLDQRNQTLKAELAAAKGLYATCSARIVNIEEDKKSDATVTDPSTYTPPDGWFMP